MMPRRLSLALAGSLALLAACAQPQPPAAHGSGVLLRAERLFDGRGERVEGGWVVVEDAHIRDVGGLAAQPPAAARVYDLAGLTLLPGLIDPHVHIDWHFDPDGRTHHPGSVETPELATVLGLENAYATLLGGVTTVQSMGAPGDVALRDGIARGLLPGPRILTSIRSVSAATGEPDEIRRFVAERAEEGADLIKVFGSASIRVGGGPTMSQEQLDAACGEAAGRGLRAAVHAHGPESARRAVEAGCTVIEHGALLDRSTDPPEITEPEQTMLSNA